MSELRIKEIDEQIAELQSEKEKLESLEKYSESKQKARDYLARSYSGRKLLENHSLNEKGLWMIKGEDPNCDFGGSHHNPEIGVFNGTLEQATVYAVQQPKFYTWGSGGKIEKINVIENQYV